jgi:hypothetical protein
MSTSLLYDLTAIDIGVFFSTLFGASRSRIARLFPAQKFLGGIAGYLPMRVDLFCVDRATYEFL